ncbi:hypothetical protein BMS3Abin01_00177 [bacterium BMS3Abin01]|nr:hypothetical protein BMS3Abin01_00177 [bacterium BMS3Abin01]
MELSEETATDLSGSGQMTSEVHDLIMHSAIAEKVWELLDHTLTLPDIAAVISSEFGLPRERALSDTRELVDIFSRADFVTVLRAPQH